MNDAGRIVRAEAGGQSGAVRLAWLALPVAGLVLALAWLLLSDPLARFDIGAPPVEAITVERTVLDGDGIRLLVRAGGSEPVTIAQVAVDDAFWSFTQSPPGPLDRMASAWIAIPYPWVLGEAHAITFLTGAGTTFEHEIAVAVPTPEPGLRQLLGQIPLGAFVGIVPVAIGLMFYPLMRDLSRRGLDFVLALTIGLLAFLLVDTLEEAIEAGLRSASGFQGLALVLLVSALTFLGLLAVGRRAGDPTGIALATYIALGIGLHNLGEGMAIGAAFAAGAAGLGTFLVLGFTLHNVTEGVGIAAPLVGHRPGAATFVGLTLLAGAPAILGLWLGSIAIAPHWAALALAIGAGAILQVIVEVGAYLARGTEGRGQGWLSGPVVGGLALGVAVMFVTGMLVKV